MSTTESFIEPLRQERNLVTAIPGPKSIELQKRRLAAVSNGIAVGTPVYIARASGGVVQDVDGNTLIDMGSGIAVTNVGHTAPEVVARAQEQVANLTHTCFPVTPYEGYVQVCEYLNELTPGNHEKRSALYNSGAEAIENAVKVARYYTKRSAVVVFEHAFHGRTNLAMSMTGKAAPYKSGFAPFASEIYRMPTSYPSHDGLTGEEAAAHTISRMEKEIGGKNIAAIVIEPIHGEGGFIVPAPGFLPALVKYANDNGIVFVADEVQTGFCRTGKWFACEHEGIVPDLITTAKGIAGGLPLSALTGRAEIMNTIHPSGMGTTFGGNPVACAAAVGSIETMKQMDLNARAQHIENVMRDRLGQIAQDTGVIMETRGRGAMMAVELVKKGTHEPDPDLTDRIAAGCAKEGVLVLTAGTYGNVLRFLPPLVMTDALLDDALTILAQVFKEQTA